MSLIVSMNYLHPNYAPSKLCNSLNQLKIGKNFNFNRKQKLRISNFTATNGSTVNGSSSSALEQLDIERGVCIPFRKYTPETISSKVLESRGSILSLVGRGVEIVWKLGLYWSALVYDYFVGRDQEVVPFRASQLRNLLCDLGPSFIKAGQVLANRPDIIREDYMNELCILQDDVPSFPNQKRNWANLLKLFSAKFHPEQ